MESSPYDEAYPVDDEDEPSQVDIHTPSPRYPQQHIHQNQIESTQQSRESEDEDEETGEEESEADDIETMIPKYDPKEFENLDVSDDIKNMFELIGGFEPQFVEMETKLCPFIPEYIPSVGDIDPFIKIPRPDGIDDGVGLLVVDEPASQQTDPGALELKLQTMHKGVTPQASIRRVKVGDGEALSKWVDSVREIHTAAPAPSVQYNGPVPDIEKLMEAWPSQIQDEIGNFELPDGPIDVVIDSACLLLDIPINNRVHALHQLLTLYQAVNETS
jgi:intraflagellar transport protein 46